MAETRGRTREERRIRSDRMMLFFTILWAITVVAVLLACSGPEAEEIPEVTQEEKTATEAEKQLEAEPVAAVVVPTVTQEPEEKDTLTCPGVYKLTAYCPCSRCCGKWGENRPVDEDGKPIVYTASGAVAKAGVTIAVDPAVIPYGTEVIIDGHRYIAQDCGGAIKGERIDVYFDDHQAAREFGVQWAAVFTEVSDG